MIPHVKLANKQVLIPTPEGPKYISPSSFNYHQILSMLPTSTLDDILPLFISPKCPNGIYYVYQLNDSIQYVNYTTNSYKFLANGKWLSTSPDKPKDELLGVFTSLAEIQDTFPEYFI